MASNNARLPLRNRVIAQRPKVDENATSRHLRQPSNIGASRFAHNAVTGAKGGVQRPALGEVTTTAVNRKENNIRLNGKEKDIPETGPKRSRSSSLAAATGPQRVPLGPGRAKVAPPVAAAVNARAPVFRAQKLQIPIHNSKRVSRVPVEPIVPEIVPRHQDIIDEDENLMDVEDVYDEDADVAHEAEHSLIVGEQEVEAMVGVEDSEEEAEAIEESEKTAAFTGPKPERVWPEISTDRAVRYRNEVDAIRRTFEGDEVDIYDTTMVSEYSDEIFEYMLELEEEMMPSADYMSGQNEITWDMRQTLVDWLLQVHLQYHLLPETLWIAVNIVDRFLTKRVVSLVKLQLVGVTAMFVASKYEEILAPGVEEFVFVTENGYSKEEIFKGERIVLQTLDFKVSQYCSPYSWMRKISQADDYDIQTRTLGKFLTEVTLLDHRFLRVKPSLIAAVGMYSARRMLGGDWSDAFVFYSDYTEEQLLPGYNLLVEKLTENRFSRLYVCKKYAHKKFLQASVFAIEWAHMQLKKECVLDEMMCQE